MESAFIVLGKILAVVIGIVAVGLLMGFPVMWLWNWLMPTIFGLVEIGFWQSVGLMLLSGFLIRSSTTGSSN